MIKTVGYAARTIAKAQTARLPPGGHVYGRESEPTFRAIGAPSAERCGTPAAHCTSRTPTDLLGFIKMTTDRGSVTRFAVLEFTSSRISSQTRPVTGESCEQHLVRTADWRRMTVAPTLSTLGSSERKARPRRSAQLKMSIPSKALRLSDEPISS